MSSITKRKGKKSINISVTLKFTWPMTMMVMVGLALDLHEVHLTTCQGGLEPPRQAREEIEWGD
jgi:hypothetical protein